MKAKRLRELLDYNSRTGIFCWRVDRGSRARKGMRAGAVLPSGYRYVMIDGKMYLAGRLAFLWKTGSWPKQLVDHRNRKRDDDRWLNLREATKPQNNANARGRTNGLKGVTLVKRVNGGAYKAQICVNYRNINLGTFENPQAAHAAYLAAARKFFGAFARAG